MLAPIGVPTGLRAASSSTDRRTTGALFGSRPHERAARIPGFALPRTPRTQAFAHVAVDQAALPGACGVVPEANQIIIFTVGMLRRMFIDWLT